MNIRVMMRFESPYGHIVLTDERKQHILAYHHDMADCFRHFALTLAKPEREIRSVHDPLAIICYKFLPHRKKYLAIVVKTGVHPFVLTAYLVKRLRGATL